MQRTRYMLCSINERVAINVINPRIRPALMPNKKDSGQRFGNGPRVARARSRQRDGLSPPQCCPFFDFGPPLISEMECPPPTLRSTMTAPFPPPTGVDMLTQAADYVRPLLDRSNPIGDRLCALWAALVSARDLGASDVVEGEFLQLAHDTRSIGRSSVGILS